MHPKLCLPTSLTTSTLQIKSSPAARAGYGGIHLKYKGNLTSLATVLALTVLPVSSTVNFQGVIPGGDSFSIPLGAITDESGMGTGFQWTPTVRPGTTLMVVSGDARGLGTGGSDLYTVSAGLNPNSSCLTNTSPSSTAGPPAGGAYPTNASGGMTSGSSGSRSVSKQPSFTPHIYPDL